jgi:hypothetical protein
LNEADLQGDIFVNDQLFFIYLLKQHRMAVAGVLLMIAITACNAPAKSQPLPQIPRRLQVP